MVTQHFLYNDWGLSLQTFSSRSKGGYTYSTDIFIKRQLWLHIFYKHFHYRQLFKTKCVSDWSIRLTSRLALMDGPKKPGPLEIRYCSAPTQGAHSGREINKDISLKHSTNLHYMYHSVTSWWWMFVEYSLHHSLWKRPHVNCHTNVGQTSLGINLTVVMFNILCHYKISWIIQIPNI